MTDAELAALEAAVEGHTAGPWRWGPTASNGGIEYADLMSGAGKILCEDTRYECGLWGEEPDKALIAAAPELLAEVRRLRAEQEELWATLGQAAEALEMFTVGFRFYGKELPEGTSWSLGFFTEWPHFNAKIRYSPEDQQQALDAEREAKQVLVKREGASDGS